METLKDEDFPARTEQFQERIKEGAVEDGLLPEAFALVREAAKRVIGERHYDVQLMGGWRFMRVTLRKWQPEKEKPFLQPVRSTLTPSVVRAFTLSPPTTT